MGDVTFLLGAGFSKPYGGPLVSELSDIVSEPPSKYYYSLGFEIRDYTATDRYGTITIKKADKTFCTDHEQIMFFEIYKSFLVSEYLNVFHNLPTYEMLLGQMSQDTFLFNNTDYTNDSRKKIIISLGDFIESTLEINDRYHNLILNCIDFLTLLVFDRIQENIEIEKVPNPLLTEYIKKIDNRATILSLNYDKVVEDILTHNNIEYTDGFESEKWDISENPIYRFSADSFVEGKVNIFKLHGSLNYGVVGEDTVSGFINTTTVKFSSKDVAKLKAEFKGKREEGYNFHNREFIIGSFNKSERYFSRTFIDLFNIGIRKLNISETLIVIGYSFQDVPINLIISNWLKKNDKKKLIVINGEFNSTEIPVSSGRAIFKSHLNEQVIDTQCYLEEMTVGKLEDYINREIL